MNCREFVDFILRYLNGEADPAERRTFEEHLEACPPCLTYLETYRSTVSLERELCQDPLGDVPAEAPEELVRAVLAARRAHDA